MSSNRSSVTLDVREAPAAVQLLDVSLDEYAKQRREQQEERLRSEGFAVATQSAAQCLEKAALGLEEARTGLADSLVETAVQLALEISQELVRKELGEGNYDLPAIVREVLASASSSSNSMILRVNPEDVDALSSIRFRSGTEVQGDPSVRRGDVQLETDQGLLVRDMDNCLSSIRERLQEAFRSC